MTDSKTDVITQTDFAHFKKEVKDNFKDLENAMFLKLSGVIIASVTVAFFALVWLFDYRFDFTNEQNQAKISELRSAVFTPSNEAIIREIRELKVQVSALQNQNRTDVVRKKFKKKQLK